MESRNAEAIPKLGFAAVFAAVLALSATSAAAIGWIPDRDADDFGTASTTGEAAAAPEGKGVLPERVVIPKIAVDMNIENPTATDAAALDRELLKGVVRYPGSGTLGETRNMLLFGHSTSFKRVVNPAFQAFNRLKELQHGDEVYVDAGAERHVYRVSSFKLDEAGDVRVDFASTKRKLTLSTCNTFGAKEERFVVEADFVRTEKRPGPGTGAPAGSTNR